MTIDTTTPGSLAGDMNRDAQAGRYRPDTMATSDTMGASDTMVPGSRDPLVDRTAAAVERVRAAAQGSAETMQAKLSDLDTVREEWTESCRTYVRERPMTALGVAVVAGFLLSRWMRTS